MRKWEKHLQTPLAKRFGCERKAGLQWAMAGRGQQVKKGMFSRQKRLLARSQERERLRNSR